MIINNDIVVGSSIMAATIAILSVSLQYNGYPLLLTALAKTASFFTAATRGYRWGIDAYRRYKKGFEKEQTKMDRLPAVAHNVSYDVEFMREFNKGGK